MKIHIFSSSEKNFGPASKILIYFASKFVWQRTKSSLRVQNNFQPPPPPPPYPLKNCFLLMSRVLVSFLRPGTAEANCSLWSSNLFIINFPRGSLDPKGILSSSLSLFLLVHKSAASQLASHVLNCLKGLHRQSKFRSYNQPLEGKQ